MAKVGITQTQTIYDAINPMANNQPKRTRSEVGGLHPGHLTRRQN